MLMRYYHAPLTDQLVRAAACPNGINAGDWREVTWEEALLLAKDRLGWVTVPINELDRGFLVGDGWSHFTFQPTDAQRRRCLTNFGRPLDGISEGLQWSELWSVLIDGMWRRIVPMRAFTLCRDWPKSMVI